MKQIRRLSDERGRIKIAALDHRGSLQKSLHPDDPAITSNEEIRSWKRRMVELFKPMVTGLLIDPIYGRGIVDGNDKIGWMVSMEKSGYRGGNLARVTELLPDWSVKKAKEMGAVAVKLLLYYDPDNRELAQKQREVAEAVASECQKEGVLFLLEPLSYKIEESREQEVIAIAEDLRGIEVDIWKFEYPGSGAGCKNITKIVGHKPWVLLSAGMEFEKYHSALRVAMESGARGFAVGRAVWQEFGDYQGERREKFWQEIAVPRMQKLVEIVDNA